MVWLFIGIWVIGTAIGWMFKKFEFSKRAKIIFMIVFLIIFNILLFAVIFPSLLS